MATKKKKLKTFMVRGAVPATVWCEVEAADEKEAMRLAEDSDEWVFGDYTKEVERLRAEVAHARRVVREFLDKDQSKAGCDETDVEYSRLAALVAGHAAPPVHDVAGLLDDDVEAMRQALLTLGVPAKNAHAALDRIEAFIRGAR